MWHKTWLMPLLAVTLISSSPAIAGEWLYLASIDDRRIDAYEINSQTGDLAHRQKLSLPASGGAMCLSPDQGWIYAALTKGAAASVASIRRSEDGQMALVKTASITSRAPYIRADLANRHLLTAHYGEGEACVFKIVDGVCTGEQTDRQVTAPTAHCIELDSSGKRAFVPHTSPNRVHLFRYDPELGKLHPLQPAFVDGPDTEHLYHQPRHITFHPSLPIAYTSNERGGGITAWRLLAGDQPLEKLQTLSTLPPNYQGDSAAADIHATPDGKFIYVSNRDLAKSEQGRDTLAGFQIDSRTGLLKPIGNFETERFPRTFCIDSKGNFLFAAGQRSNHLTAYRIDRESGRLTPLKRYETGAAPIWAFTAATRSQKPQP